MHCCLLFTYFFFIIFRHDKALEAITICGEVENKGRFSKIVDALHDDHTNLKVIIVFKTNYK